MKPVAFDYIRAAEEGEVLEVLDQSGSDAAILAGGMSLGPMLNMRLVRPAVVVDIGRVEDLRRIDKSGEEIRIGATARQSDVLGDADVIEAVPLLAQALPHVGHYQTRSRGTFGGSVAHADPSAEIPLALLVLGGTVELTSRRRRRRVAATDFFKGILVTERRPEEVITATRWPRRQPLSGYAFAEFAQRHGDFAIASAACSVELADSGTVQDVSLGLGGVEDRPILVETFGLAGAEASNEMVAAVADHAAGSATPMEDMTASAEYRRALAATLAASVLERAIATARAETAP